MMDFLFWYSIFCLTTAICITFHVLIPMYRKAGPILVRRPKLCALISFPLLVILAPTMFITLFNKDMADFMSDEFIRSRIDLQSRK